MLKHIVTSATLVVMLSSAALACNSNSASTKAYLAGAKVMHHDMDIAYSGQVDTDFARGMVPHHQGAIAMAETVLKYGKDANVRSLASWIQTSQEAEIAAMNRWLNRRGVAEPESTSAEAEALPSVAAFRASMQRMHHDMNIAYTHDADIDFVCGMIPHHEGAIAMADIVIEQGRDPEMIALSRNIIRSQYSDIARMQRWLKARQHECRLSDTAAAHH